MSVVDLQYKSIQTKANYCIRTRGNSYQVLCYMNIKSLFIEFTLYSAFPVLACLTLRRCFLLNLQKRAHQISVAAQQKLKSVQGFIGQLEGIASRTPKQEAMLQQMRDLQQKITQQVKEELDALNNQAPPAKSAPPVPAPASAGTPSSAATVQVRWNLI